MSSTGRERDDVTGGVFGPAQGTVKPKRDWSVRKKLQFGLIKLDLLALFGAARHQTHSADVR